MYNKLFTKILDSSIWLESIPTRIVWLTFIAVMDETGYVQFASVANVAHRARVTIAEAEEAIHILESPDPNSSNPDHEGRRVERVPGGWMVLNADAHRDMVTRAVIKEQTRERVRRHREKKGSNAGVTQGNEKLTPSDTDTASSTQTVSSSSRQELIGEPAYHEAYLELRSKAGSARSFDAMLATIQTPISGGPAYGWNVIGQALLEIHSTGGKATPNSIRAFCRKLTQPEPAKNGRKSGATGDGIDWTKPLPPEKPL